MSIKSILAFCSGEAQGSSGLQLAILMTRKYDAHLTAAVWHGPSLMESRYRTYMNQKIMDVLASRDAAAVAEIKADFEARIALERGLRAAFLDLRTPETSRSPIARAATASS